MWRFSPLDCLLAKIKLAYPVLSRLFTLSPAQTPHPTKRAAGLSCETIREGTQCSFLTKPCPFVIRIRHNHFSRILSGYTRNVKPFAAHLGGMIVARSSWFRQEISDKPQSKLTLVMVRAEGPCNPGGGSDFWNAGDNPKAVGKATSLRASP
jgi:hypothetical protein